jgi:hypothetical protein
MQQLHNEYRGSTPIIIVPPSMTSPLNLFNVQRLLEGGQWVSPEAARQAAQDEGGSGEKPTRVTLKRVDARGNRCQYYVTDNAAALDRRDWLKVVAVFAMGPEWQFAGWKWGEKRRPGPPGPGGLPGPEVEPPDVPPVTIFSRTLGFHVHFDADAPHANCERWAVKPLALSKVHRHGDQGIATRVWGERDVPFRERDSAPPSRTRPPRAQAIIFPFPLALTENPARTRMISRSRHRQLRLAARLVPLAARRAASGQRGRGGGARRHRSSQGRRRRGGRGRGSDGDVRPSCDSARSTLHAPCRALRET